MSNVKGKIKLIEDVMEFSSGFKKREFVVTTDDDKYPQDLKFELVKDNVSLLDGVPVGTDVNVQFNLRGSEYNGKHYVNLVAWKLELGLASAPSMPSVDDDDSEEIPFN